jgi:hypothetical protein
LNRPRANAPALARPLGSFNVRERHQRRALVPGVVFNMLLTTTIILVQGRKLSFFSGEF